MHPGRREHRPKRKSPDRVPKRRITSEMLSNIASRNLLEFMKVSLRELEGPKLVLDHPGEERSNPVLKDIPLARGKKSEGKTPHLELLSNRKMLGTQKSLRRTSFTPNHTQNQVEQPVVHGILGKRQQRPHHLKFIFIKKT